MNNILNFFVYNIIFYIIYLFNIFILNYKITISHNRLHQLIYLSINIKCLKSTPKKHHKTTIPNLKHSFNVYNNKTTF